MGNYYEGTLRIPLKKNISKNLKNALIKMCYWQEEIKKPKEWENEECFKHERWDYPNFSFGFVLKENEDIEILEYEGEDFNDETYYPKKFWQNLVGYYLDIRFCMKGYNQLGEKYINWLKPFMDNKLSNYLGEIKDEDGTYKKQFFIDDTILKKEIDSRKYICNGCNNFNENFLCDNFDICKRAYNIGFNTKKF